MRQKKINSILGGIKKFSSTSPLVFPLTLFAISQVTYGVFIFSLGFYWDDWPPILLSHIADKTSVWEYFTFDRPFQSWTYYFLFAICRDSTFAWQLAAIVFRWAAGLMLYYSFLLVFPTAKQILRWAAVLFVVFPGFADQYASVAFSSHLLIYTVFGASLLTMILSIRNKRLFWVFFPVSLVLTLVHLFSMEYFVGLEVLRPVLIFLLINDSSEKKRGVFLSALLRWLPYLGLLLLYLYWRIVVYPDWMGGVGSDNFPRLFGELVSSPRDTIFALATTVVSDLRFLFITIWTDRLIPQVLPLKSITFWLSIVIGLGTSGLVGYLLFISNKESLSEPAKKDYVSFFGIALLITLCGLLPAWSTFRQITLGKWSDRYSLAAMFGVVLGVTTLLFALFQNKKRSTILIIIVGLSISFQIQTANSYRKDFIRQTSFYQQLKWRIPGLEPGTALYSKNIPTVKEADYSYTMGINLLYSAEELDADFEYWFVTPRYYSPETLFNDPASPIEQGLRNFKFVGSASRVVSFYMPDTGCLWVVDPYYSLLQTEHDMQTNATSIPDYSLYSQINNQDLILENELANNNLSGIIDVSPQKTWCYYFEKGDFAQSKADWVSTIALYEESVQLGLVPEEGAEYLPFIKAYTAQGKIDAAVNLTDLMFKKSFYTKPMMCQFWADTLSENPEISLSSVNQVYNAENCPQFFGKE